MSAPQMTLDCPACGERIIDANPFEWGERMSPEEFSDNLRRLIDAHDDTCKPRRAKPDPEDAKRRRRWWLLEGGTVAMWVMFAAINYVVNGWDAGLAWITGAIVLAITIGSKLNIYRSGYLRGRAETMVGMPIIPAINVHPADRWRRPKEWDADDVDVPEETS